MLAHPTNPTRRVSVNAAPTLKNSFFPIPNCDFIPTSLYFDISANGYRSLELWDLQQDNSAGGKAEEVKELSDPSGFKKGWQDIVRSGYDETRQDGERNAR